MKFWFLLFSYLKFLFRSKNQHGVHSPFVYQLITKCFYNRKNNHNKGLLKKYRQKLLSSERKISIKDFGAGSRVFSSGKRKVSAIAKNAGIPLKRAQLLNRLVSYLEVKDPLELGTSLGIGSAAIACGNKVQLTTVEGCPETAAVAREQFRQFDLNNIDLRVGKFSDYIEEVLSQGKKFDLIFFDGHHQKEATLSYFRKLLPLAHNDSVFIFDDIHWSKGMEEAWNEIKDDPKVTVSIDTFYWGLVFFRKEQKKQHFTIRM